MVSLDTSPSTASISDKSSEPFSIFLKFFRAHNLVHQLNDFPLAKKWVTTLPPLPNSARHRLEDPHGAPQENEAQRLAISSFLKILVQLLCSRGYPMSMDTHIPVNAAAMLSEQAGLIEELQAAMAEQERTFREEMKSLCSAVRSEEQRHLSKTILDVESEMDRVVNSASKAVIGLEGSAAEWGQQQALLLEARQDAAKLKASILVLQTELSSAQRRIQELTDAQQDSDEAIQSLELAFVAMQNVHRSKMEERDRDESRKGFQLDCTAAQLTQLVAVQSERVIAAEESRMRLQRTHGEELLRVRLAHDAQVAQLQHTVDVLTKQKVSLSARIQELLHTQAELTGPHAKAMSTMLKNSMEMTERQYQPAVCTIRINPEDVAARAGPPMDFTSVLKPGKHPPSNALPQSPPAAVLSSDTKKSSKSSATSGKERPSSAPKASFLRPSLKGYQCTQKTVSDPPSRPAVATDAMGSNVMTTSSSSHANSHHNQSTAMQSLVVYGNVSHSRQAVAATVMEPMQMPAMPVRPQSARVGSHLARHY